MTAATAVAIRLVLGSNNVYVLPSDEGVTLIDAGPDYSGAWEELINQLHAHGIVPADVRAVVLTHAHLDHTGLAARWQAIGARIHIGRADSPILALDTTAREHERALARRELLRHGVPPDALAARPAGVLGRTPGQGGLGNHASSPAQGGRYTRWPSPLRMTALEADCLLDGDTFVGSGARRLRIVACPGHTPGTLLVIEEATGALFTGDHILPRMAPTVGIQFEDGRRRPSLPAYLASLHTARRLAGDVTAVYPGHGEPFVDLEQAIDWTVRLLEQRARRVRAALSQGPTTAHALALRLFPHLEPRHLRPALAEVVGLLDLLAERNQATVCASTEPILWSAS